MEKISSKQNKKYKYWLSLLESKQLKKSDEYLMSGANWVDEAIAKEKNIVSVILNENHSLIDQYADSSFVLDTELFKALDIYGTNSPLLILKKPQFSPWDQSSSLEGLSLLIPLGEPSNMGALLRNASAFGVKNIILLKEACSPFHPKSVRSSAGSLEEFSYYTGPSIKELKEHKELFFLDAKGKNIRNCQLPSKLQLLVGEEGPGIPTNLRSSSNSLSIPMEPSTESLNATMAASICLYELYSRDQ